MVFVPIYASYSLLSLIYLHELQSQISNYFLTSFWKGKIVKLKKKNIILLIFIFFIILSIIIIKPINDLDEIWNYNTARAISEGLIPYKDISMITTPLLPMITAIFLNLCNELIISRILAALVWTGILFTIQKILKKLIKEENISFILTALIGLLCRNIYCIDYNIMVLFLALIILFIELQNKKMDFIIGILAGLAIITKQSIGVTLSFIVIGYKILLISNKEQIKDCFKTIIIRIIGVSIPCILIMLYIIITGGLNDFINYAILGISTFSNKIAYRGLLENENLEIRLLALLVPISIILMAIYLIVSKARKKDNEKINTILTLFIYSLSIIIVMYPISDEIHFLIGSIISIIGLFFMMVLLGKTIYQRVNYKNKEKTYKIISLSVWILLFACILTTGLYNWYKYFCQEKNKEIKHFKNIKIEEYLQERINEIDEFILKQENNGKKVYILDAEAAIYMIPIKHYNKDYDMFLKGNIGKDSEQGQIEKIKKRDKNSIYLIKKNDLSLNWQTPLAVINYIRENLEILGQINIYEIYK